MREPRERASGGAPGLYVHVPFCARICPYCDFAVSPLGRAGEERFGRLLDGLRTEAGRRRGPFGADTVYFGGGTPSLAPAGFFAGVLSSLTRRGLAGGRPFVVIEANPEDLVRDPRVAGRWRDEGISGVSLGVQALDERRLRFLGRAHTAAEVREAVRRLAEAAFPWVSVDLIYGTAGSSAPDLEAELREAAALPGVVHLSAYELTIERGTPFGRRAAAGERLRARSADRGELFRIVHRVLADAGFPAYEASNFAKAPGHRSRHNRKYWDGLPYLGLGPAAHSFFPERAERSWNHPRFRRWREALSRGEPPTAASERLRPDQRALEELFLRLRTVAGLDLDAFASRYGEAVLDRNRRLFARWEDRGLVRFQRPESRTGAPKAGSHGRMKPTLAGLVLADALAREVDLGPARRERAAA